MQVNAHPALEKSESVGALGDGVKLCTIGQFEYSGILDMFEVWGAYRKPITI